MSQNITDVSAFSATVVAPAAGDLVTANSVLVGEQALANRTKYLKDYVNPSGLEISASFTRYIPLQVIQDQSDVSAPPATRRVYNPSGGISGSGEAIICLAGSSAFVFAIPLEVENNATIESAVISTKGIGTASTPDHKSKYQLQRMNVETHATSSLSSLVTDNDHTYGGGTWKTTFVSTTITATSNNLVNLGTYRYYLEVTQPYDSGSDAGMYIEWLKLICTFGGLAPK